MKKKYAWIFILLLSGYVMLAFSLPTDPQVLARYDITQKEARLLNLTIVIPIVMIYLTALYGFLRFNDYALSIRKSREGPYYKQLAKGLAVFTFGLPILSIIGSLVSYVKLRQPDLLPFATVVRGYITLILAIVAVLALAKGAEGLLATLKKRKAEESRYTLLAPIALACAFTWLITINSNNGLQGYQLPSWLVVATLAVPYTFAWTTGIRAALSLYDYKKGVRGVVYKRAFDNLAKGVGAIVAVSIFIQFITTLSEQLNRLNLTPLLAVIYLLLILYIAGYGLVARGAKRLKQIEEA